MSKFNEPRALLAATKASSRLIMERGAHKPLLTVSADTADGAMLMYADMVGDTCLYMPAPCKAALSRRLTSNNDASEDKTEVIYG